MVFFYSVIIGIINLSVVTLIEQFEEELFRDNEAKRDKRAQSNGQPFSLYVEVLIVTDYSIYLDHKKYSLSDDKNLILLHMRTYFAHYINEVY